MANPYAIRSGTPPDVNRIDIGRAGRAHPINSAGNTQRSKISFGFRWFREENNFGLRSTGKTISNSWLVSLLEKLKELGNLYQDDLDQDIRLQEAYRYHPIDWDAREIPIKKKDLNLPLEYDNDDEFPFFQFQISKAMGRFAGFWDESHIFQIVLVDPLHNLQPSRKNNYVIKPCLILGTDYEILVSDIHKQIQICSSNCNCQKLLMWKNLLSHETISPYYCISFSVTQSEYLKFSSLQQSPLEVSPQQAFQEGINHWAKLLEDEN